MDSEEGSLLLSVTATDLFGVTVWEATWFGVGVKPVVSHKIIPPPPLPSSSPSTTGDVRSGQFMHFDRPLPMA